jgi:hypothetical protein
MVCYIYFSELSAGLAAREFKINRQKKPLSGFIAEATLPIGDVLLVILL